MNGLPKVVNDYQKNPNYPTDEKFLQEVKAFKDQGLTVIIAPQICCTDLSISNRSKEWVDQYFAETTKFLTHFAKLSEQAGVEYFHYAIGSEEIKLSDQWPKVFTEIRKYFSGKVGQLVWSFGNNIGQIIPDADAIRWGDELDYFYAAIDAPISLQSNPTNDELKQGADNVLDGIKPLYTRFRKPVLLHTTYFNIKETWRGSSYYSIGDVPWEGAEEAEIQNGKYRFSSQDQARVVNAYFRSIAERPWIIGYSQFGYGHWERPLCPDLSVRGKPSEDIWRKWNNNIYRT